MTISRLVRSLSIAAIVAATIASVNAQTQTQTAARTPSPVGAAATASITAEITAIDSATRAVTLKGKDGNTATIICGTDIQRFNELKVGDMVTFQYHESIVLSIAAPGSTPPNPGTAVVRSAGDRPAGMVAKRDIAVVTVLAIDSKVPSVTIQKADGSKASFKVQNAQNLEGVKVGDKVQITYSQALAVSVK